MWLIDLAMTDDSCACVHYLQAADLTSKKLQQTKEAEKVGGVCNHSLRKNISLGAPRHALRC